MKAVPRLTRTSPAPNPGIVHFGPGAFFRAFNATYTQDAIDAAGGDWGIVAVSLKSAQARDLLEPQGCVYSSVSLSAGSNTVQIINSVTNILVAPENPAAVRALLADPRIKIVSLTITEKGYRPSADPESAIGYLAAGLAARRQAGTAPFTVLSCDNLPSNGATTRSAVLEYASAHDADLAEYIAACVAFPSTMVDRITPATKDADVNQLARETGQYDAAAVFHESFRQWIIEDNFPTGRPMWEQAGAQFVTDVTAHETMKLRCLNGTHSALAYLGYLAGYPTISDTVADPDMAALCQQLWAAEILPTLTQPKGVDLPVYCQSLLTRYRDPSMHHRTWQIAMDGSQKLPQRLLGTIRDHLALGSVPKGLCLAVAAWMRYIGGTDEHGKAIDVRDPLAEALRTASAQAETPSDRVASLLAFKDIFDDDLSGNPAFRSALAKYLRSLETLGAMATVRSLLNN